MKILIIKTVPGEINTTNLKYNIQEIGLAKALTKLGNQCDIMCCADNKPSTKQIDTEDGKKINVYCVKSTKILKNGFMHGVDKIIKEYDILHISEYNQLFTWHLSKKYKEKAIVYHGPYFSDFNKRYNLMAKVFDLFFLKRYLKLNTPFITKSKLAMNYLKEKGITNVRAIGVGIDIDMLSTDKNDKLDFVENIKEINANKLMYIGRIEPRRNPFFLLEILSKLNDEQETYLILVGSGEKEYVKDFFEEAKRRNVFDKIIYKEKIEQKYMEQLYNCSDIFILPTLYDIFGMVILEAMHFGKVILTTENGGSNMLIDNEKNGYVIKDFDTHKWNEIIKDVLSNKELKEEIEKNAKITIDNNFTWNALSNKFIEAYSQLVMKK